MLCSEAAERGKAKVNTLPRPGVLMAVTSLVFFVPIAVVSGLASPARLSAPLLTLLAGSAIYLVFGYVSVVIGCLVYNFLFRYIGGIEFESAD